MAKDGNMNFEIPAEMRAMAEKSVQQAKVAFDGFVSAAPHAVSRRTKARTAAILLKTRGSYPLAPLGPHQQHTRRRYDEPDEARERAFGLKLNRQDADQALRRQRTGSVASERQDEEKQSQDGHLSNHKCNSRVLGRPRKSRTLSSFTCCGGW